MPTVINHAIEEVYEDAVKSGLTLTLMGLSFLVGFFITIHKVTKEYWAAATDSGTTDVHKIVKLAIPYLKYIVAIVAVQFVIVFIENIFSHMQVSILEKVGFSPNHDGFIEQAQKEEEYLTKELGEGWSLDFGLWMSYLAVVIIRPIMILIDNYLFMIALSCRYLYLLMLQIVAPICIMASLYEKTEDWFWNWLKNMFGCYLLVPVFMLATMFADNLFRVLFENNMYGGTVLLIIIALKITMYSYGGSKVFQLIK